MTDTRTCDRCNSDQTHSRRFRCGGCDRLVCRRCSTTDGGPRGHRQTHECHDCRTERERETHERHWRESRERGDDVCTQCEQPHRRCREQRERLPVSNPDCEHCDGDFMVGFCSPTCERRTGAPN